MAGGIVSVGAVLLGYSTLSKVVFGVAAATFVALVLAFLARMLWSTPALGPSRPEPSVAIGYFAFVAAANVLGLRLAMAGHPAFTAGLAVPAAVAWALLNYGLPWVIVAGARRPVLQDFDGSWFLWVVGTQWLAIAAEGLAGAWHSATLDQALADTAVPLWASPLG